MANVRLVVTTNSSNIIYGAFNDADDADIEQLQKLCEMLGKLNYFSVTDENGDKVYVRGDAVESIKIESSRAR